MQNVEEIANKLKRLPDQQQDEVADFVDFLLSRLPTPPQAEQALNDTAGIWEGEVDGVTYENAMRNQWER
jgi:mRNA-degrading endonuclease RelE of RelBE toxin-antitoxin system